MFRMYYLYITINSIQEVIRMKYHYLSLVFIFISLQGMSPKKEQYYIAQYSAPTAVKEQLDQALKDTELSTCNKVGNLFVKTGIDRLKGREIILAAIAKYNCDLILVPQKYAYEYQGRTLVVAEEVISTAIYQPFNLEQVKQICTIAKKSGYHDIHRKNLQQTPDGKVTFIDTEMKGFWSRYDAMNKLKKCTNRMKSLSQIKRLPMPLEAKEYVADEIKVEELRKKYLNKRTTHP